MFELALLGPVTLRQGARVLAVPTHKAQALLLLLALDGRAHRARLAAWLWPQQDDFSARRNLRRELARLREAGAAEALAVEGETLALAGDVQCDARDFEAALDTGRAADAVALWRGALAEGLDSTGAGAFDDWLAAQRLRLQAQRRRALESASAAAIARQEPDAALAHLHSLLAEDPLQEQHHRQVMQLHAAAGRREAALAQYRQCCKLLADELGLAPTRDTQALAEHLRSSTAPPGRAPAAAATAPAPAAAPSSARQPLHWPADLPLVGREALWAQLESAWQAGRTPLLVGPAGIGKSRLAREFAASRGAHALALCRRGDGGVPYAAFTRGLRLLAGASLASAGLPAWVQAELARVLPELGAVAGPMGSAVEQRRFYEACATAWQWLADGSFDAIVIDDWQFADTPSRALLHFVLAQRAEAGAAREILVCRDEGDAAWQATLRELTEDPRCALLRPAALSSAQLLALVRQLSGAADPQRFCARLEQATGGHPFFVAETLRHWRDLQLLSAGEDGVWTTPFDDETSDYVELPLPDSVRDAVLARVQRLPDAAQRLLEAATLAAEPFTPALLAGACALSEVEALAAVEAAAQAQFLHERPGGHAFVHDLVQMALDSALPPERRRLVHRRLALGAEAAGLAPTEVARHWEAGGQPQRAVAHRIAAAEAAAALYADAQAEAHWQAALADEPTLAQQLQIHTARWGHLRQRDDGPGMLVTVTELDRLRVLAEATAGAADVALHAAIEAAHILSLSQTPAEGLRRIDACLAGPIAPPSRHAQALMVRCQALNALGRTAEGVLAGQAALAVGGLSRLQEGQVNHALVFAHFLRSEPEPALACARRSLLLWQSAGARRSVARAHANIGMLLGILDDSDAGIAELQHAQALAVELGMVQLQRELANNLSDLYLYRGRPQAVIDTIGQALALSSTHAAPLLPIFLRSMRVQAYFQLGALGAALDEAELALAMALALAPEKVAHPLVDAVSMSLDVYTAVADRAGAAALVQHLQAVPMEGMAHFRVKLAFNLICRALAEGDVAAARAHLATVGETAALDDLRDRARAQVCHAQVNLAEGQAAAALASLQPLSGTLNGAELRADACSTRLAAHAQLGHWPADALAEADAALGSGVLPAVSALALRQQRLRAARHGGEHALAERLGREMQAELRRLAASLRARPAQRRSFLARWQHAPGDAAD